MHVDFEVFVPRQGLTTVTRPNLSSQQQTRMASGELSMSLVRHRAAVRMRLEGERAAPAATWRTDQAADHVTQPWSLQLAVRIVSWPVAPDMAVRCPPWRA